MTEDAVIKSPVFRKKPKRYSTPKGRQLMENKDRMNFLQNTPRGKENSDDNNLILEQNPNILIETQCPPYVPSTAKKRISANLDSPPYSKKNTSNLRGEKFGSFSDRLNESEKHYISKYQALGVDGNPLLFLEENKMVLAFFRLFSQREPSLFSLTFSEGATIEIFGEEPRDIKETIELLGEYFTKMEARKKSLNLNHIDYEDKKRIIISYQGDACLANSEKSIEFTSSFMFHEKETKVERMKLKFQTDS